MPHTREPDLAVLHALRVKGSADEAKLGGAVGLSPEAAGAELARLERLGLVKETWGVRVLTEAGHRRHADLMAAELESSGPRSVVDDAYRRFLALNGEVLSACTAWQLVEAGGRLVANDHTDPDYDRAVVDRLVAHHGAGGPVLDDLAQALSRFAGYAPRLEAALERVVAGDGEWFTGPTVDSYHTVWFELHEDLLATLGLDRGAEASGAA